MNLLRPKSDLAGYKGMVGITVSAVIAPRVKDSAEVRSSGDDEVELVPVAGTGVSPRHFLQLLTLEEGVCDTQAMDATELLGKIKLSGKVIGKSYREKSQSI